MLGVSEMDVSCCLCGSSEQRTVFEAGVAQSARVVTCANCGLMFASPRAQLVDSDNYLRYEPEGLLDNVENDRKHPYRWRFDKESYQVHDFDQTYTLIKELHPKPGTVVELGSGMAFQLRRFKDDGWNAIGVDPWPELCSFTRRFHDIRTIPQVLANAGLPDSSVDIVILLHVIEHVDNPIETMEEIFRLLKPGGYMVLETPRYDTLTFRLLGKRERSIRQDGHIYFFTDESLQACYEKVGFRKISHVHVGRTLSFSRLVWNVANLLKQDSFTERATYASERIGLDRVRLRLNLRDMIRIIVEKPLS